VDRPRNEGWWRYGDPTPSRRRGEPGRHKALAKTASRRLAVLVDLRALTWNHLVPFLRELEQLQVAAA